MRSSNSPAKSLTRCPAVSDSDGRLFEISCPFDLKLGLHRDERGRLAIVNLLGQRSPVRRNHLGKLVSLVAESEWADPRRPVLQIKTPYVIIADEPVYLNQMPPFTYWRPTPLPGLMIPGRFPADVWPRHLMWAFEWYAPDQPLELRRGEPWWCLRFDHFDPSRSIRMVPAELTSELREYMRGIQGVTNYVDQTFQLFMTAAARRPRHLLKRKAGPAGCEHTEIDKDALMLAEAERVAVEAQCKLHAERNSGAADC